MSVSRRAAPPQLGQVVATQSSAAASGDFPSADSRRPPAGAPAAAGRHGHRSARLAVDDRDRAAPVALPREQPVAQPVADRRLAEASPSSHAVIAFLPAGADVQKSPELTSTSSSGGRRTRRPRPAGFLRATTWRTSSPYFSRTRGRARRGRDGHDRAGAVLHQHVVGDPDRDRLAVDRIDGVVAGEDAVLPLRLPLDGRPRGSAPDVVGDLGLVLRPCRQLADQRVLGRASKNVAPNSAGRVEDGQPSSVPST